MSVCVCVCVCVRVRVRVCVPVQESGRDVFAQWSTSAMRDAFHETRASLVVAAVVASVGGAADAAVSLPGEAPPLHGARGRRPDEGAAVPADEPRADGRPRGLRGNQRGAGLRVRVSISVLRAPLCIRCVCVCVRVCVCVVHTRKKSHRQFRGLCALLSVDWQHWESKSTKTTHQRTGFIGVTCSHESDRMRGGNPVTRKVVFSFSCWRRRCSRTRRRRRRRSQVRWVCKFSF